MLRTLLALGLLVAGCATPAAVAPGPDHPASPGAAAVPALVEIAALAPVPVPVVPLALRPDGRPPAGSIAGRDPVEPPHGVDHDALTDRPAATMEADEASMSHTAMHHGRTMLERPSPTPPAPLGDVPPAPVADGPMARALDAYIALHGALAADRLDAAAARAFSSAFDDLVEAPPADDPHLWHTRSSDVDAVRQSAAALVAAGNLAAARTAFAEVSAPFTALVQTAGVPEGYDLELRRCGMFDGPEGGVWLQPEGETRNPYFGGSMLTCGTHAGGDPASDHGDHQ